MVEASDGRLCGCLSVEADPPYTRVFALGMIAVPNHGRRLGAALVAENERRAQRFVLLADPWLRVAIHSGALADEPRVSALLAAYHFAGAGATRSPCRHRRATAPTRQR